MDRLHRKKFWPNCAIGATLVLLILAMQWVGYLDSLENWFYDHRARWRTSNGTLAPEVVHVDIDDMSLDMIGRWPWPRDVVAELINEIQRAGPRLIAVDELLDTPQDPQYRQSAQGVLPVDPDAELTRAIRNAGDVILATSVTFANPRLVDPREKALRDLLDNDIELEPAIAVTDLKNKGLPADGLQEYVNGNFVACRAAACGDCLIDARQNIKVPLRGDVDLDLKVLEPLLLKPDHDYTDSPLQRLLREQYTQVLAQDNIRRSCLAVPLGLPPMLQASGVIAPLRSFGQAAVGIGFVDYLPSPDGVVRYVPLLVMYQGHLLPTFSLVTACHALGVNITSIKCTRDAINIPRPGHADLSIPVRMINSPNAGMVGMFMDVPWPCGDRNWQTLYDAPKFTRPLYHESIDTIWEICQKRRHLSINTQSARDQLDDLAKGVYPELTEAVEDADTSAILGRIDRAKRLLDADIASFGASPDKRAVADILKAQKEKLDNVRDAIRQDSEEVNHLSNNLRQEFNGRIVMLGWIATGERDFVATSLCPRCPGVVVHAAMLNGILNNKFWRLVSPSANYSATIGMGIIATLAVALLSPYAATLVVALSLGGYLLVNIFVLFSQHGYLMGAAGPITAAGGVWAGLLLINQTIEIAQRSRITREFSSFNPEVVKYLLEYDSLPNEERVMTVVFTDLVGFASTVEKLRAKSLSLLENYYREMVPPLDDRRGVIKFLGDGLMCFFGAPYPNDRHASDAVSAVLEMQQRLVAFNQQSAQMPVPEEQKYPRLKMRIGVNSGPMNLGNIGPKSMCDYTVIGDTVNLASRLEGANKKFGTANLLSEKTVNHLQDEFLFRAIARIKVIGRDEPAMIYEVLSHARNADEKLRTLAVRTNDMVNHFLHAEIDRCEAALDEIAQFAGQDTLVRTYRHECTLARAAVSNGTFTGTIELSEK